MPAAESLAHSVTNMMIARSNSKNGAHGRCKIWLSINVYARKHMAAQFGKQSWRAPTIKATTTSIQMLRPLDLLDGPADVNRSCSHDGSLWLDSRIAAIALLSKPQSCYKCSFTSAQATAHLDVRPRDGRTPTTPQCPAGPRMLLPVSLPSPTRPRLALMPAQRQCIP